MFKSSKILVQQNSGPDKFKSGKYFCPAIVANQLFTWQIWLPE